MLRAVHEVSHDYSCGMLRGYACRGDRARSALKGCKQCRRHSFTGIPLLRKINGVGFHRMSSSCAMGATASGGVTFMRAFSSLIPSACFIVCLLFAWTNFHVSFAITAPNYARK